MFKVGDKVQIVNKSAFNATGYSFSPNKNGDIGFITQEFSILGCGKSYQLYSKSDRSAECSEYLGIFETSEIKLVERTINEGQPQSKGIIMDALNFVKKQALKLSDPNEFELREAGLHDDCRNLTSEGRELRDSFLEALVMDKMVETAKAINEAKKEEKK